MTTRVVCPHCGEKLVLRKPATDNTKVKCNSCRGKFYAGHSSEVRPITISDDTGIPHALVEAPRSPRTERRMAPVLEPEQATTTESFPAWLVPVGLALLAVLSIAGFNSRPSVPPPPLINPPTTFVSGDATLIPVSP